MSEPTSIDASELPGTTFGPSSLAWWGTAGFMLSEFTTLVVCFASTFYLRRHFEQWPPARAPLPGLTAAIANVGILLLLIVSMTVAARAARRFDLSRVRLALVISTLLGVASVVARGFELEALQVGWDSNAYGSIQWLTLGFHGLLLVVDLFETAMLTLFSWFVADKVGLMPDVEDAALYQWFLSLMNLPVFAIVFLLPRIG
ncbi:MAG TPA: cytochrome c oxidase subunit 3 [Gemmatimonadales bacterium]|nr:cytochrome c oxidase subunit 3 [Gemmatimonadales bacterium]